MNILQITALILLLSFYSIYIAKQMLLKRKGINTNRLTQGKKSAKTLKIETVLTIITFSLPVIQLLSIFPSRGYLLPLNFSLSFSISGILIALLGIIYFSLAVVTMKDSWRAGIDETQKTQIITNGIFGFSRNPAFIGFDLFYTGITFMFPNVVLIIITLLAIFTLHLQILEEEKYLTKTFGEEYLRYKKQTHRY